MRDLNCQMVDGCKEPVTHIDNKGCTYCTQHGIDRRNLRPCRKLRPNEIVRLKAGESIKYR